MTTAHRLALALVLAAPLARAGDLLERNAPGQPFNLQLAFDQDDLSRDLNINTKVASAELRGEAGTFTTERFPRDGVEHCFRVRVREGLLETVELLALVEGEWKVVAPEVFLFVPSDPPARRSETDEEGRVILSCWGTCNLGPGSKERGRALLVVGSGHVEGAGEARY